MGLIYKKVSTPVGTATKMRNNPIANTYAAIRTNPAGAAAFATAGASSGLQAIGKTGVAKSVIKGVGVAASTVSKSIGKSFAEKPIASTVKTFIAAPVVTTLVADKGIRQGAVGLIKKYPSDASNFTGNVVATARNPTYDNFNKTFKENPALTGGVLLTAVGVAGAAVLGVANNFVKKDIVNNVLTGGNPAIPAGAGAVLPDAPNKPPKKAKDDLLPAAGPVSDNLKNVDTPSPAPAAAAVIPAAGGQTINNYRQRNDIKIKQSFRNERFINKVVQSNRYGRPK